MNLKIFTLSTLFLFFIGNLNAQNPSSSSENTAEIMLSVRDVEGNQEFTLETDDLQYFTIGNEYSFKILLNYESEILTTTYYRLQYHFATLNLDGSINQSIPLRGTTAPVIIPPVKKSFANEYRPINIQYPYIVHSVVPLFPVNYSVTVSLCRYDNLHDYLGNINGDCSRGPEVTYILLGQRANVSTHESHVNTYPNPSTDRVTISYTDINTSKNTVAIRPKPIQLRIFNKNGRLISSKTITSYNVKNDELLYDVDISDLPKGMYFFEITHEKSKTVKTILKE